MMPKEPTKPAAETKADKPKEAAAAAAEQPELEEKKPAAEAAEATEPAVQPEPTVEPTAPIEVGQKVRHASGKVFTVVAIHSHGVKLEGVANLVDAAALEPV